MELILNKRITIEDAIRTDKMIKKIKEIYSGDREHILLSVKDDPKVIKYVREEFLNNEKFILVAAK